MTTRGTAALVAVSLALAACGSGGAAEPGAEGIDYYAEMRKIPAFANETDEDLDDLAASGCELVAQAVDAGETNEAAVDRLFAAARESGLNEAEALMASIAIVGANCPIDISE